MGSLEIRLLEQRKNKIAKLVDYCNEMGKLPSSSMYASTLDNKMYTYMLGLRVRYNESGLSDEELKIIQGSEILHKYIIGKTCQWERHLDELIEFIEKNKRFPSSAATETPEKSLYQFVHNTKSSYRQGRLSRDKIAAMNRLTPALLNSNGNNISLAINKWILAGAPRGKEIDESHFIDDETSLLGKGISNKVIGLLLKCGIVNVQDLADRIKKASDLYMQDTGFKEKCCSYGYLIIVDTQEGQELSYSLRIRTDKTTRKIISENLTRAIYRCFDKTYEKGEFAIIQSALKVVLPDLIALEQTDLDGVSENIRQALSDNSKIAGKFAEALTSYYINEDILDIGAYNLMISREGFRQRVLGGLESIVDYI